MMSRLLDGIAELLCPTRCAGCDAPGVLICPSCETDLPRIQSPTACPRCGAPHGATVCTECWERTWSFEACVALGNLEPPLSRAIVLAKDANERRLAPELASRLAGVVEAAWPGWTCQVAFVPSTTEAVRRRGFDHAAALGAGVADALGATLVGALARTRALDQRELSRASRAANVAGSFAAVAPVEGRVLLVDDVMTTGATLDACAAALLAAGAEAVRCAVLARAW